jgi:CHAT domain-containing protein/Tfp pilus assembly protein PilF
MASFPRFNRRKWSCALALTGLCTMMSGGIHPVRFASPVAQAQEMTRTPQTITGELTAVSPVWEEDGSYYEPHTFEGNAGESVTIELTSDDFNTYLILQNSAGEVLAKDDDGIGDTNSRITIRFPTTGTYTIVVKSSITINEGFYQLELREATAIEHELERATELDEQGYTLYQDSRYEESEAFLQDALVIRQQFLEPGHLLIAKSFYNLAIVHEAQGHYSEAESLYEQVIELREQQLGPEHSQTIQGLGGLADLYQSQGLYNEAESLYLEAIDVLKQQFPEHPNIPISLNSLAELYRLQGRYSEAEPLYLEAIDTLTQQAGADYSSTAIGLNNLALLYVSQGRYEEAEIFFERALPIFEQHVGPDHPGTAQILNNLAYLYSLQGRYGEAELFYRQSLVIREQKLGLDHPATAEVLNNLGFLYSSQSRYEEAESFFQQALEIHERQLGSGHPNVATSLSNLALLYFDQGRYEEAESLYQRSLAVSEQALGTDHPLTATILTNFAVFYWSQGQFQLALTTLNQGLVVEENVLRRNLVGGSDANKRDYLAMRSGVTDAAISLHLNDLPTDIAAAQLAFTRLLQQKGRILDLFTNLRAQLANDPEALTLLEELSMASTQLSNLTFSSPVNLSADSYQIQLSDLKDRIRNLEDQLSRRSTDFANLTKSPTLVDIQTTLPQSTALVEFKRYQTFEPTAPDQEQFGENRYAAYILKDNGTIQGIDLGSAEAINAAVQALSAGLASPNTPSFQVKESAQRLYDLVMAPVTAALGETTTVFLSPDGALNLIPFEALMDESGQYLVETYQFRYLTSGRDLMRLNNVVNGDSNPALLVGNPTYGHPGELVAQANTRAIDFDNRVFPTLPGTQAEVDGIASLLPDAEVYTQTNATEAVIKEQNQPSILHIATHGFFEPDEATLNPLLQSGLILAGAAAGGQSGADQDGILTALEVTGMNLQGTQLVVLSACETGLGEVTTGEGIYGLRRAFVLAGSQTQVISLWKVDDTATQELMVDYYDRLLSGTPRDAALRETQLAFLESEDYSHPYYWAAFIGSGDWRPLQQ